MNRTDLQTLATMRIREARTLLIAKQFSGAYYLSGYAVECALKACVAKTITAEWFPEKKLAQEAFTHDLTTLFKVAQLHVEFQNDRGDQPKLEVNWAIVKDWDVDSRYRVNIAEREARDMLAAVTSRRYGVLAWIKARW